MTIYLILGIYYEEEHYRCDAIEGVHKTLKGAAERLVELVDMRPYNEYEIKPINLGK